MLHALLYLNSQHMPGVLLGARCLSGKTPAVGFLSYYDTSLGCTTANEIIHKFSMA